ncbi:MAG: hypothetical protein LBV74_02755 [Tannerella sp.]|jgi:hypothetical protein|nr:hypothetical protein [Tannerella sp.]
MKEIHLWIIISGLLFLGFAATLIAGLLRKRKSIVVGSLVVLLLCGGTVSRAVYLTANKSLDKVAGLFRSRTGDEIYRALFREPCCGCVKVIRVQDQEVPAIDYAIWLEAETCPEELERILQQHPYCADIRVTHGFYPEPFSQNDWFAPETLGDSLRIFKWEKDASGNMQIIYASSDSTKMYCVDIAE